MEPYTSSYETTVVKGEYMRVIYSDFSHGSLMHLAFNMSSLFSLYYFEQLYGSYGYILLTIDLIVLIEIVCCIIRYICIYHFNMSRYIINIFSIYSQRQLGYSGIICALMCVGMMKSDYCVFNFICFKTYQIPLFGLEYIRYN